jgi:hypothetical protein
MGRRREFQPRYFTPVTNLMRARYALNSYSSSPLSTLLISVRQCIVMRFGGHCFHCQSIRQANLPQEPHRMSTKSFLRWSFIGKTMSERTTPRQRRTMSAQQHSRSGRGHMRVAKDPRTHQKSCKGNCKSCLETDTACIWPNSNSRTCKQCEELGIDCSYS